MNYEELMKKHLEDHPFSELDEIDEDWYPLGWIAVKCTCGQELTYPLDHIYGINETPSSYTHGACPKCNKVLNVKLEVWE